LPILTERWASVRAAGCPECCGRGKDQGGMMGLLNLWRGRGERRKEAGSRARTGRPLLEQLEDRCMPSATGILNPDGSLVVTGSPEAFERIALTLDSTHNQIVLNDNGVERGRFDSGSVNSITVDAEALYSIVRIAPEIDQPATINGGPGT